MSATRAPHGRVGATAMGAALVVGLCAAPGQAAPTSFLQAGADAAASAPRAAKSKVAWRDCPQADAPSKQCAFVKVPKVYGKPGRGRIRVAIARIPATGTPRQRLGSLLWDAGGPGGASTDEVGMMTARMSPRVRARFDFVAFDPRGIGGSRPAIEGCKGPWPVLPARDADPNWTRGQQRSAALLRPANRACARKAAAFVHTIGTNNVARDLNRIRLALGDDKLTF